MDPQQLEQHIEAVKGGKRAQFRPIVEAMLPVLRSYVVARSLPGIDVDEIIQRVFVETYKRIGEYRSGTQFRAWLITIARYQLLMEATRLRRQADYHSRFVPVAIARQMEQRLADDDSEDQRLPYLRECLDEIQGTSRELIRHRYEADLSMNDIAAITQRTNGAIRKQLCLIRKRLHECIDAKMNAQNGFVGGI